VKTYPESGNAGDNGAVLGRREGVECGADRALGLDGRLPLDVDLLGGRHVDGCGVLIGAGWLRSV